MNINLDAHSIGGIDNLQWCVAVARKSGIPPKPVMNCMSAQQFDSFPFGKKAKATQ
jgi:histidinol phosphatase-like PHP family hydrolase